MDRLNFIKNTTLALGAGFALPTAIHYNNTVQPDSVKSWEDIRNHFLLEDDKIHMAQMLLASHPAPVRDAIKKHREAFDANPSGYWNKNFQTAEPIVLNSAAAYLETKPSEIALTDSTTQGLGILYTGFKLSEEDEILTTTHDHYSTDKALEFAAQKNGASINRISLYDKAADASVDEIVNRMTDAITPATKLIAVTYVHSSTGVKLPIREMADAIQELNGRRADRIYLAVDGVHGFGVENITMDQLGCDFFVAGTHKWLFGPRGTGIIWAKEDAWDMIVPTIPAFSYNAYGMYLGMIPEGKLNFSDLCTPGGYHAFDHRWALNEAFDFHMEIGKDRIENRTHYMSQFLKDGLMEMDHITLHTPLSGALSSGINCFEVEGMPPAEVVEKLGSKQIVASSTPYRESYARIAPCIINTEEEVTQCLEAVENLKT